MTSIWRKVPKIGGKYVMNSAPELNIGGNMYPRGMAEKLEHNFSYISNWQPVSIGFCNLRGEV